MLFINFLISFTYTQNIQYAIYRIERPQNDRLPPQKRNRIILLLLFLPPPPWLSIRLRPSSARYDIFVYNIMLRRLQRVRTYILLLYRVFCFNLLNDVLWLKKKKNGIKNTAHTTTARRWPGGSATVSRAANNVFLSRGVALLLP